MTFGKWIELQLTDAPEQTQVDVRLGLAKLGLKDVEIMKMTLDQVVDVAEVLNIPAEDLALVLVERRCRVCGCTDDDCTQCVEKTGEPCHWVARDLCSACSLVVQEGGQHEK